jgi:hypothetical protein
MRLLDEIERQEEIEIIDFWLGKLKDWLTAFKDSLKR